MWPSKSLKKSKKHSKEIQKTFKRYPKDIQKTFKIYPRDIQKTFERYPKDIQKTFKRHSKDIQKKAGLYKIQLWFLLIFRHQTKVSLQIYKSNRFWDDFWECICMPGFPWFGFCRSAGCPWSQKKWGWCLDFCRPESFLFTCYVFCFCRGRFGVFQKCVYKMWSPTPTRSIFGGIHISFWWLGHIPLLTIHIPMFNDSTVVVDDEFPYILWCFLKWGMIPKSQSWSNLGWFEGTLKFPNIHTTYLITLTCVLLCSTHPPATSRPSWIY